MQIGGMCLRAASSHLPNQPYIFLAIPLVFPRQGPIYKSIEALDRAGMEAIETGDPAVFRQYLAETQNTICGRHPIGILLQVRPSRAKSLSSYVGAVFSCQMAGRPTHWVMLSLTRTAALARRRSRAPVCRPRSASPATPNRQRATRPPNPA